MLHSLKVALVVNVSVKRKKFWREFLEVINFALLFSQEKKTSVMLRSMPGSLKGVSVRGTLFCVRRLLHVQDFRKPLKTISDS